MHLKASAFRSFFHPILRFLGMLSHPPSELEFPSEIGVEVWEALLRERYCSRDPVKGPKDRSRMETLKVITIRRYKEKRNVEHEYLVAKVLDPDSNNLHYLRFDRTSPSL